MLDFTGPDRWGWDRQEHYSQATQEALRSFQAYHADYINETKKNRSPEVWHKLQLTQEAWDELMRCRREETGVSFYLSPEAYRDMVESQRSQATKELQC